jgi:hypothetical protein
MTIITIRDLRANGICPDAHKWCAANGIDWRGFVTNGIHVNELRATGDNMDAIDRLEATAKGRVANGQ